MICINIKWCFIRFFILIKFNIVVSSEGIITSLLSHTLLCDSSLFFCSKRMKKIQTIIFFDVIPLSNADSFLMQDNANVIRLT